jgi:cobaltochelatase CobN
VTPVRPTPELAAPAAAPLTVASRADDSLAGPTILLVSTADTDLLAARAASYAPEDSGASTAGSTAGSESGSGNAAPRVRYRVANPARVTSADLPALLDGVRVAVVRLLGGARVWEDGLAALAHAGIPTIALGGEATPDADLMALSSVPMNAVAATSAYLLAGGPENLRRLAAYLDAAVVRGDSPAVAEEDDVLLDS